MVFRAVALVALAACATCSLVEQTLTPDNGLQALEDVEKALHKMLGTKTDKALLKTAVPVVQLVDRTVQELESGRLTKKDTSEKVLFAIKELQGLQSRLEKGSKVEQVQKLLAAKKADLIKEEGLLKELAKKKQKLKVLTEEKDAAISHPKEVQEISQEESTVAGLLNMAHDLASTKRAVNMSMSGKSTSDEVAVKNTRVEAPKAATVMTTGVPKELQAILINLQDRAHNLSADLHRMDAEENMREKTLDKQIDMHVPTSGSTDAINKGAAMLKQLKKQEQRSYKKARALRQSLLTELNDGIREVETGDVGGLTSLMGKIQARMKKLDSSAKGFLH